jgi:hypothetical protein
VSRERGRVAIRNAKRFLQPGPTRTYETSARGATRSLGQVLNDEHRHPVRVVVAGYGRRRGGPGPTA